MAIRLVSLDPAAHPIHESSEDVCSWHIKNNMSWPNQCMVLRETSQSGKLVYGC